MKLLNVILIVLIFRISKTLDIPIPWYLWAIFILAWLVDLRSQTILEYNVITNGKNIHSIGNWLDRKFGKIEEGEEKEKEDEEVLH